MNHDEGIIKIDLSIWNNNMCLKIKNDNDCQWFYQPIKNQRPNHQEIMYYWVLSKLKIVFYMMPVRKINVNHSKEAVEYLGDYLKMCLVFLQNTNELMEKYRSRKGTGRHFKNILMFNIDKNISGNDLFEQAQKTSKKHIFYQNMATGFNAELRKWEPAEPPFEINALISYLVKNKVKRIISINHYLLEKYLFMKGIFLLAVLDYLGMEYIIYDQDVYELTWQGYLHQDLFNHIHWQRYSHSNMHEYWDLQLKHDNISYVGMINFSQKESRPFEIDSDYKILIMSHSRYENVGKALPAFLYIMHHLEEQNLFFNFQIWYRALRYMILEMMPLDELDKMYYNHQLHSIFYTSIQILKYEVIENMETERIIEIYGDNGWARVFPQYFKNKYLRQEEKNELLSLRQHILLLPPSFSINLLFRELTIIDAIANGTPFLYMTSPAKLDGYEALEAIEYGSPVELNARIDRVDTIYRDKNLLKGLQNYRNLVADHSVQFADHLFSIANSNKRFDGYDYRLKQINRDINGSIRQFIDKHETFLRDCFNVLLKGEPVHFDFTGSKYYNRGYVQKILSNK